MAEPQGKGRGCRVFRCTEGLGNADCGFHLICCYLFWLSWRFSVLCRIPLILGSLCLFVLSSGTWKHVLMHKEGRRTIIVGDWERAEVNRGWNWSQEQKGWAQGSFLFWKCFCQVTLTGQELNKIYLAVARQECSWVGQVLLGCTASSGSWLGRGNSLVSQMASPCGTWAFSVLKSFDSWVLEAQVLEWSEQGLYLL